MSPPALSRAQLEELLHQRENLRCVRARPNGPGHLEISLPRQMAIDLCLLYSATLAGPIAREHNFGVCFTADGGERTFLETGHA